MGRDVFSCAMIRSQSFSETELGISLPPCQRLKGAGLGVSFPLDLLGSGKIVSL